MLQLIYSDKACSALISLIYLLKPLNSILNIFSTFEIFANFCGLFNFFFHGIFQITSSFNYERFESVLLNLNWLWSVNRNALFQALFFEKRKKERKLFVENMSVK